MICSFDVGQAKAELEENRLVIGHEVLGITTYELINCSDPAARRDAVSRCQLQDTQTESGYSRSRLAGPYDVVQYMQTSTVRSKGYDYRDTDRYSNDSRSSRTYT